MVDSKPTSPQNSHVHVRFGRLNDSASISIVVTERGNWLGVERREVKTRPTSSVCIGVIERGECKGHNAPEACQQSNKENLT